MFIAIFIKYDVPLKQIIMIKHFERLLKYTAMNNIRIGNLVLKCHLKLLLCAGCQGTL